MKCRKCKELSTIEEKIVHLRETHGFPWEYINNEKKKNIDWQKVEELWNKHKSTGKKSINNMFKKYLGGNND